MKRSEFVVAAAVLALGSVAFVACEKYVDPSQQKKVQGAGAADSAAGPGTAAVADPDADAASGVSPGKSPRVLIVVAHPDDEYCFAATSYRIARELGGTVDQVIITNGEGGFRYSTLAESYYGLNLTREEVGRANLPRIRRQELLSSGQVLGIRNHSFLGETDFRYTQDAAEPLSKWTDQGGRARRAIEDILKAGHYDFVFTLLPVEWFGDDGKPQGTHGHHKAATILALQAVQDLSAGERPVVLGCSGSSDHYGGTVTEREAADEMKRADEFKGMRDFPITKVLDGGPVLKFDRTQSFGRNNRLDYEQIVNQMLTEHRSQGDFQNYFRRLYESETYRLYDMNDSTAVAKATALFELLARR